MDRSLTTNAMGEASVRLPGHVVYRSFEAETILLNLGTGEYHGLNPSAARMFGLLCETGSVREAIHRAAHEFDQPIDVIGHDMTELCAELAARDLIEVDGGSS